MPNTYLLKLSPDSTINESATTYRKYYSLAKEFKFVAPDTTNPSSKADSNWTTLKTGVLEGVTLEDTVLIVAHGSKTTVAEKEVHDLAVALSRWGLTKAGCIIFKSCDVGRADFLERFVEKAHAMKMDIGFVRGYRGTSHTIPLLKPFELVHHNGSIKSGSKRYKIVQGKRVTYNQGDLNMLSLED
ncbi:hypothetical protein [Aquabacterium sp.]|uniref:hypothetical protein n=1 Tax=Aquabacterium sp. TaxID=1872578 RepID=UPI001993C307|nr:hypothetical protein [Aquabacterium sp.]MBC7701510.1 hypothetical protein [Aquabacterium sp.]